MPSRHRIISRSVQLSCEIEAISAPSWGLAGWLGLSLAKGSWRLPLRFCGGWGVKQIVKLNYIRGWSCVVFLMSWKFGVEFDNYVQLPSTFKLTHWKKNIFGQLDKDKCVLGQNILWTNIPFTKISLDTCHLKCLNTLLNKA